MSLDCSDDPFQLIARVDVEFFVYMPYVHLSSALGYDEGLGDFGDAFSLR